MQSGGLHVVSMVRALVEVAMFALLGQGILGMLAGSTRQDNPIYQLFRVVTRPVVRGFAILLPDDLPASVLPVVVFFILFGLWFVLALLKRLF